MTLRTYNLIKTQYNSMMSIEYKDKTDFEAGQMYHLEVEVDKDGKVYSVYKKGVIKKVQYFQEYLGNKTHLTIEIL